MISLRLPPRSLWANLPKDILQKYLIDAQQAYNDLIIGAKPVSVSYSQETGAKSVTYTQANAQQLLIYIQSLQQALGISRRRATRVWFR